jgi:hypothetical protein
MEWLKSPKLRNTREENAFIKESAIPFELGAKESKHELAQKDTEARWSKKNSEPTLASRTASTPTNAQAHSRIPSPMRRCMTGPSCWIRKQMSAATNVPSMPTAVKSPRSERAWNTSSVRRREWANTEGANWLAAGKGQNRDDDFGVQHDEVRWSDAKGKLRPQSHE